MRNAKMPELKVTLFIAELKKLSSYPTRCYHKFRSKFVFALIITQTTQTHNYLAKEYLKRDCDL